MMMFSTSTCTMNPSYVEVAMKAPGITEGATVIMPDISEQLAHQLQQLNIRPIEYALILKHLGRTPNFEELCMFSALWSEHCAYKHTRHLLKKLPITGERVVQGPGENAGVIRIEEGLDVTFKVESHNHPTAVEPYHGAATGVGGILRDIFTMNARPVANLNALRFGPTDHPRSNYLIQHAVHGIAHYGNCMGIPTIGGDVFFHDSYKGNPLVNAMSVGVIEPEGMMSSKVKGIGNPVVYAGSPTGKDGIGGASFASRSLDEEKAAEDRPAVQVGDPFAEKVLMEACLEAFKTGAIVAAQDMGAAGITCGAAEMSAKGGTGMKVDLNLIPAREPNMQPFEFLLSESQERMLFVVESHRTEEIFQIFRKWGVPCCVVGEVTDTGLVEIMQGERLVAQLPATLLTDDAPQFIPVSVPDEPDFLKLRRETQPEATLQDIEPHQVLETLRQMLERSNIIHPEAIYSQYDRHVRNGTRVSSEANASGVIELRHPATHQFTGKGLGVTLGGNARHVALEPYMGSKNVLSESARNLAATGCLPLGVTDNLNYGDPETADVYYQLYYSVEGMKEACLAFDAPVTGGNCSLYNTTEAGSAILPSLVVGTIGLVEDITKTLTPEFKQVGHHVALLGRFRPSLGGSEYQELQGQALCGEPPQVDLEAEATLVNLLAHHIAPQQSLASVQDVSLGGLLTTLAECLLKTPSYAMTADKTSETRLGLEVSLPDGLFEQGKHRWDVTCFGETAGCYIVSGTPEQIASLQTSVAQYPEALGIQVYVLGTLNTTGVLSLHDQPAHFTMSCETLSQAWRTPLYQPRRSFKSHV
ncbi:MAG: phosphoribosylformylglycinamidine synthase subunit PurL [Vampirovibrionales bacterium]